MKTQLSFAAYLVVSVLAILSGLEFSLNYILNNPRSCPDELYESMRLYYREFDQSIIQYEPEMAQYDSGQFYTLKPGNFQYENREFDNEFSVNSLGLRDDERSLQSPEIIVLGDSYSMGWGVDQDSTYAQLLERQLDRTVLNAGISSYGTAREFGMLNRINTDSLKILILQYCPNDLTENINYIKNNHRLSVSSEETWNQLVADKEEKKRYYPFKHLISLSRSLKRYNETTGHRPAQKKAEGKKFGAAEAFLSIIRDSEKIANDVMIIVFNLEAEHVNNGFINLIKASLDKQFASSLHDRVSYIDLTGKLDNSHRFVWDPHLNASGHKVIAYEISKHIEQWSTGYEKRFWVYETGDTSIVCDYFDGLKHGTFKSYWPNGNVSRTSTFKNGFQVGKQVDYFEDGSIRSTSILSEGR